MTPTNSNRTSPFGCGAPARRLRVIATTLMVILPVVFGLPAAIAADRAATQAKLQQGGRDLGEVRRQIESANQRIDAARARQSKQQAELEAAERKLSTSRRQLEAARQAVRAQAQAVRAAESRLAAAQAALAAARAQLAAQVRAAFIAGRGGETALVLAQDEPGRLPRLLGYYDHLNAARARQIDDIQLETERVAAEQDGLETERAELEAVERQRVAALQALESDRAHRAKAVAALNRELEQDDAERKRLIADARALEALLDELRAALTALPPPVAAPSERGRAPAAPGGKPLKPGQWRGRLAWPLRGPIIAHYGDAKQDSRLQWKGLWIAAGEGTAVRASAAGRVAYVGWLSSYGLIVVVEHADGFFTLYGHNATVTAAAGDTVKGGDVIAAVGNSGGYEQSGLYFEVRRGTTPVDPRDWLVR